MTLTNSKPTCKILFFVCVAVIIWQFVMLYQMSGRMSIINNYMGDINVAKATIVYRSIELQTIGQQLPSNLKLTSAIRRITTKDVFSGRKTLVYNFTQMQCKMCIESQVEALKAIFGDDTTSVVLLANTTNYRNIQVFSHTHNIKFPIYKLDEPLNLPPDTLMIPYFLLVDEDLRIANAFITMKERMNYSIHYLKSMYKYFHSENVGTNTLDITIDKTNIDLGNVKNGSTRNVVFTISNNSLQNIQLDVIPDCDCTTIDFGNGTLQAQEKRQITATIKFDEKGNFFKYIYVYYNGNQNPMEVEIRGNVN